ncbi:Lrp/AsnC family transcriptional regulator [Rhizobium sp. SEMIA 4085]|jgi:Lrp/AsnC family transcriptional regulator|uniref:AsnC family transcriptional regulator protein n=3 Tax=Rhizobium TaxID=379 RepID=A0A0B4X2Q5_9HYPH|nr:MULTISPECIES: Lrp/AsnC family transcriptional regulator [Rhizobium]AJD40793.1 AsnC family transcriptional regulator protein [Rhizobium gallicum bv. gallicum R602sp]APO74311.1 AsnC family transcriptional regulator protein [Rhizobium etli 8C-3]NNH30461.1 Lrp/AsnC family transcriptional regulator [Rhizobium sp. SEMIA 4085]TCU23052.1 AsnC family transcriptional regulator [Rhizobium azibense]TCU36630.1 AsnC family transcriptional regulator [Rhizobium azibense]
MKENLKAARKLLQLVQAGSSLSLAELAEKAGMSQSTAWRKMQELETEGVIRKRVALLDPAKLDLKLCIIAHVTLEDHHEEAIEAFAAAVRDRPEIMECYALSGTFDYMLKIRARDVEAYEAFMTRYLMRNPHVRNVVSSFVLRELKSTTELPI